LLKHEPSAQIPWANTMLGLVGVDIFSSPLAGYDDAIALAARATLATSHGRAIFECAR